MSRHPETQATERHQALGRLSDSWTDLEKAAVVFTEADLVGVVAIEPETEAELRYAWGDR